LNGSKLESLIYLPIFTVLDFILVSTFDIAEFASEKHCSISQHFMSFIINSSINWVDPFKIDLHFDICNLKWQIQYLENSRINVWSADKVVGSETFQSLWSLQFNSVIHSFSPKPLKQYLSVGVQLLWHVCSFCYK